MNLSKLFLMVLVGSLPLTGCGSNESSISNDPAHHQENESVSENPIESENSNNKNDLSNSHSKNKPPSSGITIVNPADLGIPPRPREIVDKCSIISGLPEEGLGYYDQSSDTYDFDFTFKKDFLDCDHNGPNQQSCSIKKGGYVTWLENAERRYIRANDGMVRILLKYKIGVRCN